MLNGHSNGFKTLTCSDTNSPADDPSRKESDAAAKACHALQQ